LRQQEIFVSRVSNFRYTKNMLTVGSSKESQPLISFGDRISEFGNLSFGGLQDKTLDYEFTKSDLPKCKGGIPQGYLWVHVF
jgi:hypothetical protein